MWQDFEGSIYWDELAETCSDISRAAGFRGNTVCVVSYVAFFFFFATFSLMVLLARDYVMLAQCLPPTRLRVTSYSRSGGERMNDSEPL